jgi:hypothetical protein
MEDRTLSGSHGHWIFPEKGRLRLIAEEHGSVFMRQEITPEQRATATGAGAESNFFKGAP